MKNLFTKLMLAVLLLGATLAVSAQERRPVDSQHPLWLVHVDVWNKADPQKIIDLIPEDVRPYVCMNLSLSCQYDTEKNVYKMPQNAVKTYKSWGTVCQQNGMWFTCQPASGGHTHIQDNDLETFEYFFKAFPNFLGWNYAEQFWGFDEANDKSSSPQASRIALFAKLVPMHHKYGGFLTVSFCGNIWSHLLNPVGMMKRNKDLLKACQNYPEAILWLYKYTTSSCFYNNESVTFSPFISGLAKNYGVRYDNCGWNGAMDALLGENHGKKYPVAAGIGTVMEQTCVNGGAVWDGPELIWTEDFQNLNNSTVSGYTRRNWGTFPGFRNAWIDMFRKIIDGTMYIPTREEVVKKTKIVVVNDVSSGNDEQKYAAWGDLYDGLYKQADPFNRGNGQWMDNFCYFKKTGRYGAIPVCIGLYDDLAKSIPVQVKKSAYTSRWSSQTRKVADFNKQYPEVSTGDLYVNRFKNQLVTYTPYTYMNKKTTASAEIPLEYNTCEKLQLTWGKLSSGIIHEYADSITFYLNNYRIDTTTVTLDKVVVTGASSEPTYTMKKRVDAKTSATTEWDAETGTFTLNVKHCGPVDVVLYCAGAATERSTDVVSSEPLPLPKQPEVYRGPITIEAEDMDFKSIKSCVTDPYGWYPNVRGHAGNGFADMGTNTSGALRHVLNTTEAGDGRVAIRYTSPSKIATIAVSMNGSRKAVRLEKTQSNEWKRAFVDVTMKEGANTLIITNSGGTGIYIDNVTYLPAGAEDEKYSVTIREAEHGSVIADVNEAAEGETVTLTVVADEGYKLQSLQVINSVYFTMNKYITIPADGPITFTMPDEGMTLLPVFADATAVYTLDFSSVLSGTIPAGWVATQENNEVHQYPNKYDAGARTFAGFTGYQGKALYWRNGSAEYGKQAAYPLSLEAGEYKVTFAMAAWKSTPKYKMQVLDASGNAVVESDTYIATPNANGNSGANIKSAKTYELPFTVTEAGKYTIRFTDKTSGDGFHEFLLLECRINAVESPDAIIATSAESGSTLPVGIYSPSGIRQQSLQKGLNIVKTADGRTKKVFCR
ncbi:MAG: glycosyl hydrolase family 98 [Bacteroidaceae bacterium]|nr:glycosyl hydrolase family 98 [Bacteroidaceae bacterium]